MIKLLLSNIVLALLVQPVPLISKVLIIKWKDADFYNKAVTGFTQVVSSDYEVFDCQGSKDELNKILNKSGSYDLICVVGETPLKSITNLNLEKPIVFAMVYNPRLIIKGKNNITGASLNISFQAQFSIINKVLPQAKKIGILYSKDEVIAGSEKFLDRINLKKVANTDEITEGLAQLKRCNLIMMVPDPILSSSDVISSFLLFGMENKIPIFGLSDKSVKSGALFGLSPNYRENGRLAAILANEIIEAGKVPAIKEMENGNLYLNLKTAKELGIKIPTEVIKESAEVFE